jgi:hypothetical protein
MCVEYNEKGTELCLKIEEHGHPNADKVHVSPQLRDEAIRALLPATMTGYTPP